MRSALVSCVLVLAVVTEIGCSHVMTSDPLDHDTRALLDRARGKDRPIMDTHVHLYQVDRPGGVPFPPRENTILFKSSLPAGYRAAAEPHGVLGAGIVEASNAPGDNQWVLDQIAGDPYFPFFVAELEVGSPGFVAELDALARDRKVVGIRSFLWSPKLTLDGKQVADLQELARRGMTLDIVSRYALNPKAKVDQLAKAVPALRIIIDHLAGAKNATPDPAWVADMQTLAKNSNVWIKLSSFFDMFNPSPVGDEGQPWTSPQDVESYRAHFDVLLAAFGPDRLIWGSNYPVVAMGGSLAAEIDLAEKYLASKGKEIRDKVMFRNAVLFYRRMVP